MGVDARLLQLDGAQVLFMSFSTDVELPEHAHEAQSGMVLAGRIDLTVSGVTQTYRRGDVYAIPAGVPHSARIHAGYADITYFDVPDRYQCKDSRRSRSDSGGTGAPARPSA